MAVLSRQRKITYEGQNMKQLSRVFTVFFCDCIIIIMIFYVAIIVKIQCISPVSQNAEGEQLIVEMREMLGVPVFAFSDMLGAQITEGEREERTR